MKIEILIALVLLLAGANFAFAQTTGFTYQGKLVDGTMPANASYDFEFRLFAVETGGAALATNARPNVSASNGIFTVQLDFGSQFPGASRWLEIAVKTAGGATLTTLNPRQPVFSSPYAVRSLNSANADNAASATNLTGNLSGDVSGTQGATVVNIVGGQSAASVASATQSINTATSANTPNTLVRRDAGGDFSANTVSAATQYNINSSRVLSAGGTRNLFAGINAGPLNSSGADNSSFGFVAGRANQTGSNNSYFGSEAGSTIAGSDNSFFGYRTGNPSVSPTFGNQNSFFGKQAGGSIGNGDNNSFFGVQAGFSNSTGDNNTAIGHSSDVGSGNLSFATAIGAGAVVNNNNSVVLGRVADTVRVPGILNVTGGASLNSTLLVGGNAIFADNVSVSVLGSAGSTNLCRNGSSQISTCSSSLRYKRSVQPFSNGLDVVRRLRPIAFSWRDGGMRDVGFAAEAVNEVEPLLTTRNDKGEIEGVKYGQVTTVLVNAVQQQQQLIEQQQKQIDEQRRQIGSLRKIVCLAQPHARLCKERR